MTHHSFFRTGRLTVCLGGALLCAITGSFAQTSEVEPDSEPVEVLATNTIPLDDITQRLVMQEHKPLAYAPIREADILWEKRLWRIIDVREKINQSFIAPESPLFPILVAAIMSGQLRVYSTESDRFDKPLLQDEVRAMLFNKDTIMTLEGEEMTEEKVKIVENEMNWEDIKRFRIKESWYFDANTATLKVRILGIAPLVDVRDENGDFRFEKPLFWVHYPSARPLLAHHKAIVHNDNYTANFTWEDLFETRRFASCIYKENNTLDLRIKDYKEGADMVHEAKKIETELFAKEHDLWSF